MTASAGRLIPRVLEFFDGEGGASVASLLGMTPQVKQIRTLVPESHESAPLPAQLSEAETRRPVTRVAKGRATQHGPSGAKQPANGPPRSASAPRIPEAAPAERTGGVPQTSTLADHSTMRAEAPVGTAPERRTTAAAQALAADQANGTAPSRAPANPGSSGEAQLPGGVTLHDPSHPLRYLAATVRLPEGNPTKRALARTSHSGTGGLAVDVHCDFSPCLASEDSLHKGFGVKVTVSDSAGGCLRSEVTHRGPSVEDAVASYEPHPREQGAFQAMLTGDLQQHHPPRGEQCKLRLATIAGLARAVAKHLYPDRPLGRKGLTDGAVQTRAEQRWRAAQVPPMSRKNY
jgi:hypothetical protein